MEELALRCPGVHRSWLRLLLPAEPVPSVAVFRIRRRWICNGTTAAGSWPASHDLCGRASSQYHVQHSGWSAGFSIASFSQDRFCAFHPDHPQLNRLTAFHIPDTARAGWKLKLGLHWERIPQEMNDHGANQTARIADFAVCNRREIRCRCAP